MGDLEKKGITYDVHKKVIGPLTEFVFSRLERLVETGRKIDLEKELIQLQKETAMYKEFDDNEVDDEYLESVEQVAIDNALETIYEKFLKKQISPTELGSELQREFEHQVEYLYEALKEDRK